MSEREPYVVPKLTRHGSLEELTQGAGGKAVEKASNVAAPAP
jgi:hypothetical protein